MVRILEQPVRVADKRRDVVAERGLAALRAPQQRGGAVVERVSERRGEPVRPCADDDGVPRDLSLVSRRPPM